MEIFSSVKNRFVYYFVLLFLSVSYGWCLWSFISTPPINELCPYIPLGLFRSFPLYESATVASLWSMEMNGVSFLFVQLSSLLPGCAQQYVHPVSVLPLLQQKHILCSIAMYQLHLHQISLEGNRDLVNCRNCTSIMCVTCFETQMGHHCLLYLLWFHCTW